MRVVAGKFRNRNLKSTRHFRPTTDRVRETLFNILQNEIEGAVFVDVFAGSGAVGIEAISRGAAFAHFIESNRKTVEVLESNLRACCAKENWRIYSLSAMKGLEVLRQREPRVDFVFLDPPYDFQQYPEILAGCASLFPEATYILEASARTNFQAPPVMKLQGRRKIGETVLWFYHS
jgi:16S rRNA (guanine966-N2)-methyltransferase